MVPISALQLVLGLFVLAPVASSAAEVLELMPGHTKIVQLPDVTVQGIAIGNPNVADARPVNQSTIAFTGKAIGTTTVALFNDRGERVIEATIQVVAGADYEGDDVVQQRREVRIRYPGSASGAGARADARYETFLCLQDPPASSPGSRRSRGCAPVPVVTSTPRGETAGAGGGQETRSTLIFTTTTPAQPQEVPVQ